MFGWGAGLTHLLDLAQAGNDAPNTAGAILYADIFVPLARLILYGLFIRRPLHRPTMPQPVYWSDHGAAGLAPPVPGGKRRLKQ